MNINAYKENSGYENWTETMGLSPSSQTDAEQTFLTVEETEPLSTVEETTMLDEVDQEDKLIDDQNNWISESFHVLIWSAYKAEITNSTHEECSQFENLTLMDEKVELQILLDFIFNDMTIRCAKNFVNFVTEIVKKGFDNVIESNEKILEMARDEEVELHENVELVVDQEVELNEDIKRLMDKYSGEVKWLCGTIGITCTADACHDRELLGRLIPHQTQKLFTFNFDTSVRLLRFSYKFFKFKEMLESIETAKRRAQKEGRKISECIQEYFIDNTNLHGQKALIEIAKLATQQDARGTSKFIQNYGIDASTPEGQKALIEIAKLAAQRDGEGISFYIRNYGIKTSTSEGQNALIAIAKLAAQQHGWGTSEFVQNYDIDRTTPEGRLAIIEIAKLAAQQDAVGTFFCLRNYDLLGYPGGFQAAFEISKLAFQKNGDSISEHIQPPDIANFPTDWQKAWIANAKLAAQQDGRRTSEHIHQHGIDASSLEGQKALIEIAKLAVQQNSRETSIHIQNYGIDSSTPEGQKALFEIAKLAAQQDGEGTSFYIQNYGIAASTPEGQKALIEIAKLAAQQNGRGITEHIQNYGIDRSTPEGQKGLIEIAKLAAQREGEMTTLCIKNYGINKSTPEGQKGLIEIAKVAVQSNVNGTFKYIQCYKLDLATPERQEEFIEFVKLAAQQDATKICSLIQDNYKLRKFFELEGKDRYSELIRFIFTHMALQMPPFATETYKKHFHSFNIQMRYHYLNPPYTFNNDTFFDKPFNLLAGGELQGALKEGVEICQKIFVMEESNLLWTLKALNKNKESFNQKRFLEWFLVTASLFATSKDLIELFKNQQETFKIIAKQNPHLREALVKEFIHLSYLNNIDGFEKMTRTCGEVVHVKLACLCLANFPKVNEEGYIKILEKLKKERLFREGKNQKLLLETLIKIKLTSLEDTQKVILINSLFKLPESERLQSLRLVSDIIAFKSASILSEFSSLEQLNNYLSELFTQNLKVKIDNFGENYEKTLSTWRKKEVLMTYAGKLNELPSPKKDKALKFFQEFLTGILKDNFKQDRYRVDKNPHLAEIKRTHEKVFEHWQLGENLTNAEIEMVWESKTEGMPVAARVIKSLKQALEQQHLGGDKQGELYPALSGNINNEDTLIERLDSIETELESYTEGKLSSEKFEKKQQLLIQKKILELFQTPEALERNLTNLKSLIPKTEVFYSDIEDSLKMLKTDDLEKAKKYQVLDTDDPNHFLMMGTEVLNSCQNVHGKPEINICLLGYFLDGKHRLALVCDDRGHIFARSVLRLLIDAQGQPVLFQERVYVADATPEYPKLLRNLALKKAVSLGIPLVVSKKDFENEDAKPYPHLIHAKLKPVPFEYVDALGDKQEGAYVIQNALQIT